MRAALLWSLLRLKDCQRFDLHGSTVIVGSVLNLGLCAVLASKSDYRGSVGQNWPERIPVCSEHALLVKCLHSAKLVASRLEQATF